MEERIDEFQAVADDGTVYTVYEFAAVILTPVLRGGKKRSLGPRRLALADGRHVNDTRNPGVFQIFDTGQIILKIG